MPQVRSYPSPAAPEYPVRHVLTEEQAATHGPGDLVRFGGYLFARTASGAWAMVEAFDDCA